MKQTAIITGADGGMGTEITRAVAAAGYRVIMACVNKERAEQKRRQLVVDTANPDIEVRYIDLSSLQTVADFADTLLQEGTPIALLMNNAGTMETGLHFTVDGLERTVSVNYVAPYLLTRKLLPLMEKEGRIVCMVSCTYAIGHLHFPDFFTRGRKGAFWRIPVYSNTKLALTLFTLKLSALLQTESGREALGLGCDELHTDICVNCADPGIVSTDIITMHMWFDPLTDLFFRPFIRTPLQGAATAIHLLLSNEAATYSGTMWASGKPRLLGNHYLQHPQADELWQRTEELVRKWL